MDSGNAVEEISAPVAFKENEIDQADALPKLTNLLNVNSYLTKKTLTQGMLDLALLSANASQLKFIITLGHQHEFYTLLIWLVSLSICLQVIQAVTCVVLGLIFNINNVDEQKTINIINDVSLAIALFVVAINIIISAFDIKSADNFAKKCHI